MSVPEIYADYHDVDDDNCVRLTKVGTRRDLAKHGIELQDGLKITVYMDDADDAGNRDDLMADAVVRYNSRDKCWVAAIDWDEVKNRSEREREKLGSKNGAARAGRKKRAVRSRKSRKLAKVSKRR